MLNHYAKDNGCWIRSNSIFKIPKPTKLLQIKRKREY